MHGSIIDRIGKYEVQSEIGLGAFGRVFRAYDPTVNRPVAIKILTAEGKDLITRFRTEASAAGNLRHKNIVTIYEFGEHKGRPFIAMELLEGSDLSQVIAAPGSLTLLQKMRIMSQVAEGLHCAHSNGVLHRDVKPANIKLLPDGTVKILDFGIARLTRDREATRLTQQGDLIGTILYMAPEQFSGSEVDRLCDIFAYGSIYYELLAGKHPFASSDPRNVMFKITFQDPEPLREVAPEVPEGLEHIVNRALQKDRDLRYQNLRDLLIDAKPILLELEHRHAAALLAAAQEHFGRGEFEAAEAKAIEVIDLDLGIREAHEIREAVQKQIHLRVVRPKIDTLLRSAEENVAKKRFSEAVANYEAALRLDRTNAGIREQLDGARNLLERGRKAASLLSDARIELEQGHLEAAASNVAAALELDPENEEGSRIRRRIDHEAEARRRREIRATALREARSLLDANDPDAALLALGELATTAGKDTEIAAVVERANAAREEIARARQRAEGISRAGGQPRSAGWNVPKRSHR
jgi:tetratricopeptide (TPR) repeat protein